MSLVLESALLQGIPALSYQFLTVKVELILIGLVKDLERKFLQACFISLEGLCGHQLWSLVVDHFQGLKFGACAQGLVQNGPK